MVSTHWLIQVEFRNHLDQETRIKRWCEAVDLLRAAFPRQEKDSPVFHKRLRRLSSWKRSFPGTHELDEESLLVPPGQGGKPKGTAVKVEVRQWHRGNGVA